jgi:hypothetical protein
MKMPFPFGKRDFVITKWNFHDSSDIRTSLLYSISRPDLSNNKYIRGIFDSSGIILEPDKTDPEYISVQWIHQIDIQSSVPKWLVGSFWKKYYDAMVRLQATLEGREIKKTRRDFVKLSQEVQ